MRNQRSSLQEERKTAEKQLRLIKQQIILTENQQTIAAEAEDFDLADRLAAVIGKHKSEEEELSAVLAEFERALGELDRQQVGLVHGVTDCFKDIRSRLVRFKEEQETRKKEENLKVSMNICCP